MIGLGVGLIGGVHRYFLNRYKLKVDNKNIDTRKYLLFKIL